MDVSSLTNSKMKKSIFHVSGWKWNFTLEFVNAETYSEEKGVKNDKQMKV